MKDFEQAVQSRRSHYAIGRNMPVPDARVEEIVRRAVKYGPTAFNSQSARVILLLGEAHEKLWDMTADILKGIVPEADFPQTKARLDSFRAGYGTILFFEDQPTVEGLQAAFPLYRDNFPIWSQQSSGMAQYIAWTGLEAEGLGVTCSIITP
jgi:predicted oxidoreductase (fatty acid repression mutant protein)